MDKSKYLAFVGLASEIVFLQILFIYAGRWADDKFGTTPFCMVVGSLLALVVWMLHIVKALKSLEDTQE